MAFDVNKLFDRMATEPIRRIDKKPRNVLRTQFAESETRDAKLAERVIISQIDVVAAKWNSQIALGYWELQHLFTKSRDTRR